MNYGLQAKDHAVRHQNEHQLEELKVWLRNMARAQNTARIQMKGEDLNSVTLREQSTKPGAVPVVSWGAVALDRAGQNIPAVEEEIRWRENE